MAEELIDNVVELYKQDKWLEILSLYDTVDAKARRKLLWAWPSESNIDFLRQKMKKLGVQGVTSVGSGCGLLEWILSKTLELSVKGIEVNQEWWNSRHSGPKFIEHQFLETPLTETSLESTHGLLFCYFNDGAAFQNYVNVFKGRVIIIIGPKDGVNRYTNPSPFTPLLNDEEWKLDSHEEVRNDGDFIAVYVREAKVRSK